MTGTLTFAAGQTTRTILVCTLDDTLSEPAETFAVNLSNPVGATLADDQAIGTITDTDPPALRVASVDGGAAQRSRVTQLAVTFSGVAALPADPAAAFQLSRIGGGPVGFTATAQTAGGVTVVTLFAFTGAEADGGSLADDRYALTVLASQLANFDGDGAAGGDYVSPPDTAAGGPGLYRLYGDATGDGVVDLFDLGLFRSTFNRAAPDPLYLGFLDSNGDGVIDLFDLGAFRTRFNTTVLP